MSETLQRVPYFQQDFAAGEFIARRNRIMDAIGNVAALVRGERATGAFDLFRQNNEFYYLCGVEVPVAYLLIDGARRVSTLYLPPLDPKHETSEGAQLSDQDGQLAREWSGIEEVKPLNQLREDLPRLRNLYLTTAPLEGKQACRDTLGYALRQNALDPFPPLPGQVVERSNDLTPILDRLRMIKSPAELKLMARAGRLSALAAIEAMRSSRPGVYEYQLAAAAEYIYLLNGARDGGYRPIVASGRDNIWNIHYYRNSSALRDGELVLFDYAPDCGNYTSDIGRMWPVSGTYSPLQRELYGFVVEYHKILLRNILPSLTVQEVLASARIEAAPLLESWRWSKPIYRQAAERLLVFEGSLSHPVGMAVHDVGNYKAAPLALGVTFAVDPQMWVPEEQRYIRVEDTVAVTETGIQNLTCAAPLELDDVERAMKEPGLIGFRAADFGPAPGIPG